LRAEPPRGKRSPELEQALEQDRRQVEVLFSTKPVRVRVASKEFVIPANYLSPKGRDLPLDMEGSFLQFVLFLPEFEGFTRSNWEQGWFDRRRIDVIEASEDHEQRTPERLLEVLGSSMEPTPFSKVAGLSGYRRKNGIAGATWYGRKPSGELFCLQTSRASGDPLPPGTYPLCKVQYFRQSKRIFLAYQYSMDHLELWAQIDEAIWSKIEHWRAN
jgi:hypothetical protein